MRYKRRGSTGRRRRSGGFSRRRRSYSRQRVPGHPGRVGYRL